MSDMKEVSHKFPQQTMCTHIKYKFILYLDMLIASNFPSTIFFQLLMAFYL